VFNAEDAKSAEKEKGRHISSASSAPSALKDGPPHKPRACVSVDLDTLGCYREIHGLDAEFVDGPDAAYTVGVRRLLELFEAAAVPATLFVIGRDLEEPAHADILAEAAAGGAELGNHSYSHFYDLAKRSPRIQRVEIARAEEAIAATSGRRPVGYRAPGYNITPEILGILAERGYLYDSSIFACPAYYAAKGAIMACRRLAGRPSRSAMTPASNLLAPLGPYRPDAERIWRPDDASRLPLEIPMCLVPGVRFPIIGTSLHLLGKAGFDAVWPLLRSSHSQILQLEFHAVDFMDADDVGSPELIAAQPDLRIPWPQKREIYVHVLQRLRESYAFSTLEEAATGLQTLRG
jgi:peptidoglycan-N-acetylglucosamine deacetylase